MTLSCLAFGLTDCVGEGEVAKGSRMNQDSPFKHTLSTLVFFLLSLLSLIHWILPSNTHSLPTLSSSSSFSLIYLISCKVSLSVSPPEFHCQSPLPNFILVRFVPDGIGTE